MKRCKVITCWTDYPFVELGDAPGQRAKVRHVWVMDYDNNKYATVLVWGRGKGITTYVKAGYLYSKKGRYGQVKQVNVRKLERMVR